MIIVEVRNSLSGCNVLSGPHIQRRGPLQKKLLHLKVIFYLVHEMEQIPLLICLQKCDTEEDT